MASDQRAAASPIVAAFSAESGRTEPVEFGLAASDVTGAPLVVITAGHGGDAGEEPRTLTDLRRDLQARGFAPDIRAVAGARLTDALADLEPQLVVLGTSHRGTAGAALLGTTVERVIHESACPVAVVPHGYRRPEGGVRTIGAGFALTDEGRAALHVAARLARVTGGRLRAITVLSPDRAAEQSHGLLAEQHRDVESAEGDAARERLHEVAQLREALAAVAGGIDTDVDVLFNDAADGLLAAARHVDLLVVGSRAQGARRSVILGSVSRKVAERAACPVVVLPRGALAAADALLARAEASGTPQPPRS
jgi:nucleotide-binding universal stress UspA family protein